jgi:hypothetical protein
MWSGTDRHCWVSVPQPNLRARRRLAQVGLNTCEAQQIPRAQAKTLTIKDLSLTEELDRKALAAVRGGIGRTGVQILAGQLSHQPATWQGLVLGDDDRLHAPTI